MAKIYDALKRAEEERKRHTDEVAVAPSPLEFAPTEVPSGSADRGKGLIKRLSERRRMKRTKLAAGDVNKRRITLLQPDSYVAEQYRALRGRIDAIASQRPIRTLAVTSALPGEGKTTASINLSIVTAMSLGRHVLLIDCDMRRPKVHESLGLRPDAGLAEVLSDKVDLDDAIVKVEGVNLEVLAVKARPLNPSELLGSAKMREVMEEVARRYDRVILDTPAVLGLPDAKIISELSDGLVLVVRADKTSSQDVQSTLEILDRRRLLGLVLNGAQVDQGRYGYAR
jgi:capsular exopolysaccharide synthesis family protein